MLRFFAALVLALGLSVPAIAQEGAAAPRAETGGAQTLDDILRRQAQQKVDDEFRRSNTGDPAAAAPITAPLGTRGGQSDSDLWRALRYDTADVTTQTRGPAARVLIQDGGMWWLKFREGPLLIYGAALLGGTLLLLALFYLIRGRIRIKGEKTGRTITRFSGVERFGHWLLASSFLILGLTGLISLFGRKVLIPAFGHEAFATLATGTKWIHNNISWAFMIALVIIFVFWVVHNLPDRTDLNWLAKGGGIFGKGHPPAKKFNAGQKLIFWSVIILGGSISASGLSLLFPFEFNMFGATFAKLNAIGAPGWVGLDPLAYPLTPQEEMQYAQLWHAILSLILTAIIFAHIYIGSIGMEGAFDAMGSGDVEEQWAREHHSLWVDDLRASEISQGKEA
ncbi:formate dehydrogenase subunit gamma [Roseovarius dicentrarchi]|uniref:formate dehydrogenase subunit gamma n=1 Tax=Roseovarius dicentrarchi TaxID=2250573 RepID=UPI000DEA2AA8|nr:formate dehydrogenase subunit gamma [Roseovarius dicentrarchi]